MPFIPFKFKKANAPTRLADFDTQPTWKDLASEIAQLFDIPLKEVSVAFVDKHNDTVSLNNEKDLQRLYKSLDQSSEEIKFVVRDLRTPNGESLSVSSIRLRVYFLLAPSAPTDVFIYYKSALIHFLPCVFMTRRILAPLSSYLSLLHQPTPQSLQLGQQVRLCLIYPRAVSGQQSDQ